MINKKAWRALFLRRLKRVFCRRCGEKLQPHYPHKYYNEYTGKPVLGRKELVCKNALCHSATYLPSEFV